MKTKILIFGLVVFCLISFACATGGNIPVYPGGEVLLKNDSAIVAGVLENGLSYRILRNQYPENRIAFRLVIKAGSVHEAGNQRGLAHLVEHMAFNGSEHFSGNELIHYFESIGAFGPDLNAYTSFDETVYMLEIPADNPGALATSLTVIADWASGLKFDEAELEKERGVVLEEWRSRRGVTARAWDALMPFLFPLSRYANRMPIGKPEIIRTAPRKRIVDFYNKWYRPELMTVIITGDADPALLERALVERLSAIPPSAKKIKSPEYGVFNPGMKLSLRFQDPESPYTQVYMGSLFPAIHPKTVDDYRLLTAIEISQSVLNARLRERLQDEDSLLNTEAFSMEPLNSMSAGVVWFSPQKEKFETAFQQALDEVDRLAQFGVTESEMERQKANMRANALNARQNREKTESRYLADHLVRGVVTDTPLLSPDDAYNLTIDTINTLTINYVNEVIRHYYTGRGTRLIVSASDDSGVPSKAGIERIWKKYRNASLGPYDDRLEERPLFPPELAANPGAIIAERRVPASGESPALTELTLSNGAKVIVCPTDFRKDRVLFDAVSRGGLSIIDDADYPSAASAANYVFFSGLNGFRQTDVTKKLAGKTAEAGLSLNETSAGLWGSAAARDLETLFQLANLYISSPHFTGAAWERVQSNVASRIEAVEKYPQDTFRNELDKFIYGDSVRFTEPGPAFLAALDRSAAEQAYRRLFGGAGNCTFIFTGDVDLDEIKRLSARYLASLPSGERKTEARDNYPPFPEGKPVIRFRKGIEQQGMAALLFGGVNDVIEGDVFVEQDLLAAMAELVQMRLWETIREKMGAIYGVTVNFQQDQYPSRRFSAQIFFGCEPARAEELAELAINELRAMQEEPAAETELVKQREGFIRRRETGAKTNNFWQNAISANLMRGEASARISDSETVLAALNGETMRRLIGRYFNTENYVSGFLLPSNL